MKDLTKKANTEMKSKEEFINHLETHWSAHGSKSYEGFYNIDTSKSNMHSFTNFKLALIETAARLELYFIDAEEFGYRKSWNAGDLYAYAEKKEEDLFTLPILVNESRGDEKVPTPYQLILSNNGIQIVANGRRQYTDHYLKINRNELSDTILFTDLNARPATKEELININQEDQGGIELMYWLSKLEEDNLTNEILLDGLNKSLQAINKGLDYPFAEYNNVWQATFSISLSFAQLVRQTHQWKWMHVDKYKGQGVGWILVSSDNKSGIRVESVFYDAIMKSEPIDLIKYYELISNTESEDVPFQFLELPQS